MTEKSEFSRHLAFGRQLWNEINQITPIDNIEERWCELPDSTKKALEGKLFRLHSHLAEIERIEKQRILDGDLPWQEVSKELAEFYRNKLRPRFNSLRDLWLVDIVSNIEVFHADASTNDTAVNDDVASFIRAAIWRCEGLWEQFLESNSVFTEYAFEQASRLVASNLFRPDRWLENHEDLKPIVSDKEASKIPLHVRARLTEIYNSFIFGNWLAIKSLARSLLEYEILDRSGPLEISVHKDNGDTRDIGVLTHLVADKIPTLEEAMDLIVSHGNDVMHPKKKKNVEMIITKRGREEALDCIRAIQKITEQLYQ